MKRRQFFKFLIAGVAVALVNPISLVKKPKLALPKWKPIVNPTTLCTGPWPVQYNHHLIDKMINENISR